MGRIAGEDHRAVDEFVQRPGVRHVETVPLQGPGYVGAEPVQVPGEPVVDTRLAQPPVEGGLGVDTEVAAPDVTGGAGREAAIGPVCLAWSAGPGLTQRPVTPFGARRADRPSIAAERAAFVAP